MTVLIPKHGISYRAVPKNACTSLKQVFFQIENGRPFEPMVRNGRMFHIHNFYGSGKFDPLGPGRIKRFWKIAVIRDPVKRLVSVWRNRVMHHNELDANRLAPALVEAGLTPRPGLEEFALRLKEYCAASQEIHHHALPHVFFLGEDAGYYDRLYQMSELPQMVADLSARVGRALTLPREQTGGPPADAAMLSPEAVASLRDFYRRDYEVFRFE